MKVAIDIPICIIENTPYYEEVKNLLREHLKKAIESFLKDRAVREILTKAYQYKDESLFLTYGN